MSSNNEWDAGNGCTVYKQAGGWSGAYNPRTTKPYAVRTPTGWLKNAAGAIRTFASVDAARKAVA